MGPIAIVATVKVPLAVLKPWINYHLHSGIDRLILYFDDPRDPAIAAMQGIEQVTAIACSEAYWQETGQARPDRLGALQVLNVNHGFSLAAGMGCSWAAHIDSDELIVPSVALSELLAGSRADALKMTVLEAISERSDYDSIFDASLFKRVPNRLQLAAAILLGCRHAIRFREYFRGHTESKMLIRLNAGIRRMGIHKPIDCSSEAQIELTKEIQLLHFDCVGFTDWDGKWRSRLEDSREAMRFRPARQKQFAAYGEVADKSVEVREALFRELQVIPTRELAILKSLRMVTGVELDRSHLVSS